MPKKTADQPVEPGSVEKMQYGFFPHEEGAYLAGELRFGPLELVAFPYSIDLPDDAPIRIFESAEKAAEELAKRKDDINTRRGVQV